MNIHKARLPLLLAAVLLPVVLLTFSLSHASGQSDPANPPYAPDRVIVKLRAERDAGDETLKSPVLRSEAAEEAVLRHGGMAVKRLFDGGIATTPATNTPPAANAPGKRGLERVYRMQLERNKTVEQTLVELRADPNVEWAEPDYLAFPADTTPNDPLLPEQWGLAKISAPAAWDTTQGDASVVIAIVDSGIDRTHTDLASKLWTNPGEIAGNGLDDDNNGYIDDVNGWDFVGGDNDPSDDNGHGTQAAGIAGAATDNAKGIAGVCWNCKLMSVKVMQAGGVANYSDIAAGVLYAAKKGAKVINLSLGGYGNSTALQSAVQEATDTYGAIVVAGAGNDNVSTPFYPAAYEEVLAVAGTDDGDLKSNFSNYGEWVDVSAPGEAITTTFLGGDWGPANGTSFAAPFASGLAGLLHSQHIDWSPALVKSQIEHTVDAIDSLNPTYAGQLGRGRIDAAAAVTTAPQPVLAIAGTSVNGDPFGKPTPGQSAGLKVTLSNDWLDADGVQGTLSTTDGQVTINQNASGYGDIPAGGSAESTQVYTFTVAAGAGYNHAIPFTLHLTANGGAYTKNLNFTITTRSADEHFSGTIGSDMTWTSDKTYIIDANVGVAPGVTLTVQAGTVIKFNGNFNLNVGGTLIADGTVAKPIRFLPYTAGGTWGKIFFDDPAADAVFDLWGNYSHGNVLRNVEIKGAAEGIRCSGATPFLSRLAVDGGGIDCTLGSDRFWLDNSQITGDVTASASVAKIAEEAPEACLAAAAGQPLWSHTYDFPGYDGEHVSSYLFDMKATTDGGYILVGRGYESTYGSRIYATKVDPDGYVEWTRAYGPGTAVDTSLARVVVETQDGYAIAGDVYLSENMNLSHYYVISIDKTGQVTWQKSFGQGSETENIITSILAVPDGGLVIAGTSIHSGYETERDAWLVRLGETGEIIWQKEIPGYHPTAMAYASDSEFLMTAEGGRALKLDLDANILWSKVYSGGSFTMLDIQRTADQGFIITGSNGGVMKLDQAGDPSWGVSISGMTNIESVVQTPDGGYILAGTDGTSGVLTRIDSLGALAWQKRYHPLPLNGSRVVAQTPDGNFVAGGTAWTNSSSQYFWLVKADPQGHIGNACSLVQTSNATITPLTITAAAETLTVTNATGVANSTTYGGLGDLNSVVQSTQCSQGLPLKYNILRSTITGALSLPGMADVRDTQAGGAITLGHNSIVQRSESGGVTINGMGYVTSNTVNGDVSVTSGVISDTVTTGNIAIGGGTIWNNQLTGGGITAGAGSLVGHNNIEKAPDWAIAASGAVTVTQNRMIDSGNGIQVTGGRIQGNLVANNTGIGIQIGGNVNVISNTLTGNAGSAIKLNSGTNITIKGNNLEGNKGTYDIENRILKATLMSVLAQGNWWGTTGNSAISTRIFDYNDEYNYGQVLYAPAASGPIQNAPAYVRSVVMTPPSPVGIQTAQFDVQFSRPMQALPYPLLKALEKPGNWVQKAGIPAGIDRMVIGAVTAQNGKIYVAGNTIDDTLIFLEYDPNLDTWQQIPIQNDQIRQNPGIAIGGNGKVYLIGGYGKVLVEEYSPETGTWVRRKDLAQGRSHFATATGKNGKIYLFGGYGDLTRADEYDPWTDTWRSLAAIPGGFSWGSAATTTDGLIYVSDENGRFMVFDPVLNTWDYRTGTTYGWILTSLVAPDNGKLYAIGGRDGIGGLDQKTVEEYDPASDSWRRLTDLTFGRYMAAVTSTADGSIYAIGGNYLAEEYTNRVDAYHVPLDYRGFYQSNWPTTSRFSTLADISAIFPRNDYTLVIQDALGTDSLAIAPNDAFTFTVDYAGSISDMTPPFPPAVTACGSATRGTVSASWTAHDTDSAITLYRYAIGTTSGGTEIVNWTTISSSSFTRTGLGLTAGQKVYISVMARNDAGLWSLASTPPAITAGSAACTTNSNYSLSLAPATQVKSGNAGTTVTYSLAVTNTGNTTDNFNVTVNSAWTANAPATVGPLPPGESASFDVVITVPAGAADGASNQAVVTVTSQASPAVKSQATLVTTVNPVYQFSLAPATLALTGNPGTTVIYSLAVKNTGNTTDIFSVSVASPWTAGAPATIGPLAPGESKSLNISIAIPAGTANGAFTHAAVTVKSQGNPAIQAQATLTTTATTAPVVKKNLYMPIVRK